MSGLLLIYLIQSHPVQQRTIFESDEQYLSLMTNGIRLFACFHCSIPLAFAVVMLLTRNDGLSF